MLLSIKEILFFSLIFILLLLSSISYTPDYKKLSLITIINIFQIIFLIFIYKISIISTQKDTFDFSVTPAKLCEGGPYMISSAPQQIKDYCYNLWKTPEGMHEYNASNCQPGFSGSPLCFHYTPETNKEWKNERCK